MFEEWTPWRCLPPLIYFVCRQDQVVIFRDANGLPSDGSACKPSCPHPEWKWPWGDIHCWLVTDCTWYLSDKIMACSQQNGLGWRGRRSKRTQALCRPQTACLARFIQKTSRASRKQEGWWTSYMWWWGRASNFPCYPYFVSRLWGTVCPSSIISHSPFK